MHCLLDAQPISGVPLFGELAVTIAGAAYPSASLSLEALGR